MRAAPWVVRAQAHPVASSSYLLQVCGTDGPALADLELILLPSPVVHNCQCPCAASRLWPLLVLCCSRGLAANACMWRSAPQCQIVPCFT